MSAQYGAADTPHPPELRPLAAGDPERVGDYTLAGRLADDGASTLYGALDPSGAPAALRVAGERLAADPGFRSAFAERAAALGGVSGVCVVPVLAADPGADRPWLAAGLPVGPTLGDRVEGGGPLPGDALFALAAGTAEALTAVHAAGLCYGTITPDDVVLAYGGPRIAGLGAVGGTGGSALGPAAPSDAAALWASPERADGEEASPSGDLFSWGCLIAYAATGRHPYAPANAPDSSDPARVRRRIDQDSPDLTGVPAELAPLIGLAVAADPGARPTAESTFRGLIAFASGDDDTAQVPTPELSGRLGAILAAGWSGAGAGQPTQAPWSAPAAPPEPPAGILAAASSDRPAPPEGTGAPDATASAGPADTGTPRSPAPGLRRAGAPATAVVTALSMATAIAIGASGFVAAGAFAGGSAAPDASASPSSQFGTAGEAVAGAAQALRNAENYRAVDEVGGGEQREYVLATLAGREHFQSVTLLGEPEEPAAGSTARIYEPASDRLIQRDFGGGVEGRYYPAPGGAGDAAAWRNSRDAVLAPFKGMRTSMDVAERIEGTLNGTPGLHITGTFGFTAPGESGPQEHSDVPFDLWIDEQGRPLRLAYTAGGTAHDWTYSGFGGLSSRICGVVEGVPDVERAYLVPTRGATSCGDVRPVVEEYLAVPEEEQQASGYVAEVGGWTCELAPMPDGSAETRGSGADAGACYRGAIGAAERVDLVVLG